MTKLMTNLQTICCNNLLKDLPERQKDVLIRRFGLEGEKQTLESVGSHYGITRERVRQIEEDGLKRLQEKIKIGDPQCQNVFQEFVKTIKDHGSLKREDLLLSQLGGEKFRNHVFFLLTLGKPFQRYSETPDLYAFWAIDKDAPNLAQKAIGLFVSELKKKQKPLPLEASVSYIEISKKILKGPEGFYGLLEWPEINPRGIKDKAYLVFKKIQKPLHFTQVAQHIGKDALPQTVHNELIRDPRFVLVGRGLYALGEWGYTPGIVRQVIADVLALKGPVDKEQILEEVLKQRQVKPNTILLNLNDKKYFVKDSGGKYTVKKA